MRVAVTRRGGSLKRASLVLDVAGQREAGKIIRDGIRRNIEAGRLADGQPAPPDRHGDGRELYETGKLLASIRVRTSRTRGLIVAPDYKRVPYAIYLIVGVNKGETLRRIAAGELRKRREYKRESDMVMEPRPFTGMSTDTLARVAKVNEVTFKRWFDGRLSSARIRGRVVVGG